MHSILKKSKQQGATYLKDRDAISTVAKKPRLFDAARTEAVKRKKVCDLMRLGGNILRQIMQHRWAWPFLQPVDVEGLQLHDYYQIIRNPMDLGTIRSRLEAKDGTGYGHVRELCEDVRLVFRNAMLYNESWTEVHVMAKALLAKFENKWKTSIEPRLLEEEEKLFEDQSEGYMVEVARVRTQDEQTAEQLHKDVLSQLTGVEKKLNDLLARFLSKSRPMKAEERRELYSRLKGLPAGSMSRVAELVSSGNGDKIDSDDISVDLETLDSSTLWRLHFFEKLVTQHVQEQAVSTSQIASSHQAK